MNYFSFSVSLCSSLTTTWDFYSTAFDTQSGYRIIVIKGVLSACSVTKLATDILRLQGVTSDDNSTAREKLEELIRTALMANGVAICTRAIKNYSEGDSFLNLDNIKECVQIVGDLEDLYQFRKILTTFANPTISVLERPQLTEAVKKGAIVVYKKGKAVYDVSATQTTNLYMKSLSWLSPIDSPPIAFDLADTENLVPQANYLDIPFGSLHNKVFRRFICPIACRPIRYPVIILDQTLTAPMKLPIVLFERREIIKLLSKAATRFYPDTQEPIALNQVKEYVAARDIIEDEMAKLEI